MSDILLYSYANSDSSPGNCQILDKYWGKSGITKVTLAGTDSYIKLSDGAYEEISEENYIPGFYHESKMLYAGGVVEGNCPHLISNAASPALILRFRQTTDSTIHLLLRVNNREYQNFAQNLSEGSYHLHVFNNGTKEYYIKIYSLDSNSEVFSQVYPDYENVASNIESNVMYYNFSGYSYLAPPLYLSSNYSMEWFPFLPTYLDYYGIRTAISNITRSLDKEEGEVTETITTGFTKVTPGYPKSYLHLGSNILNRVEPPKLLSPPTSTIPNSMSAYKTNYKILDNYLLNNATIVDNSISDFVWASTTYTDITYKDKDYISSDALLKKGCRPLLNYLPIGELKDRAITIPDDRKFNCRRLTKMYLFRGSDGAVYNTDTEESQFAPNSSDLVIPASVNAKWLIIELQAGGGGGANDGLLVEVEWARSVYKVFGGSSGNYLLGVIPLMTLDESKNIIYRVETGRGGSPQQNQGNHDGGDAGVESINIPGMYLKASGGYGGDSGTSIMYHRGAKSNSAKFFGEGYPSNLILFEKKGVLGDGSSISGGSSAYSDTYKGTSYSSHSNPYHWSGAAINEYHVYGGGPSLWSNSVKYEENGYANSGLGGGSGDWNHGFWTGWTAENNSGSGGSGFVRIMY